MIKQTEILSRMRNIDLLFMIVSDTHIVKDS